MEPRQPTVILLDLDDTIVDFDSGAVPAWRAVCEGTALEVGGLNADALFNAITEVRTWYWSDPERHRVGRGNLNEATRGIIEQALVRLGHNARLAQTMADIYREYRAQGITVFPGAIETLARLREQGIRLGLVTNGARVEQRAKIERFELAPYFDHILIEGELGYGKPDERVYRAAMAALRTEPTQTWFVGDNLEWDVAAPQRLGLYTVWVDVARVGLPANAPAQPQRIVHALSEL